MAGVIGVCVITNNCQPWSMITGMRLLSSAQMDRIVNHIFVEHVWFIQPLSLSVPFLFLSTVSCGSSEFYPRLFRPYVLPCLFLTIPTHTESVTPTRALHKHKLHVHTHTTCVEFKMDYMCFCFRSTGSCSFLFPVTVSKGYWQTNRWSRFPHTQRTQWITFPFSCCRTATTRWSGVMAWLRQSFFLVW